MSGERRLNLALLEQALAQFDVSLAEYEAEPERRANRDSVVIHFMLTYELAIQAIKRYVELQSLKDSSGQDVSFQTIIRRADALGVLRTGWPAFGRYRDARNAIAHTYDEQKAIAVVRMARDFRDEARYLLEELKESLSDGE